MKRNLGGFSDGAREQEQTNDRDGRHFEVAAERFQDVDRSPRHEAQVGEDGRIIE